jgi:nitrogen fixation NifU-like protein
MKENIDPNWIGEDDIYRENIIDHYKNPRNFGELKEADIEKSELNPICGDTIKLFVKLKESKISEVKFKGKGCAISLAAASMLTEKLIGKTIEEVKNIKKEDVFEMLGIELGIVRMKCGLLCLNTLLKGVEEMKK